MTTDVIWMIPGSVYQWIADVSAGNTELLFYRNEYHG